MTNTKEFLDVIGVQHKVELKFLAWALTRIDLSDCFTDREILRATNEFLYGVSARQLGLEQTLLPVRITYSGKKFGIAFFSIKSSAKPGVELMVQNKSILDL